MTNLEKAALDALEDLSKELEGWSIVQDDTFSLRAKLSAALDALEDLDREQLGLPPMDRRCYNGEETM